MRLLIIAKPDSVHTVRWISQVEDQDWSVHLFPSNYSGLHKDIKNVTFHQVFNGNLKNQIKRYLDDRVKIIAVPVFHDKLSYYANGGLNRLYPTFKIRKLARLIDRIRPDVVHTMETQRAGYLMVDTIPWLNNEIPPWLHTTWGSDLYLFGRLHDHKEKLKRVFSSCDFYIAEGNRDCALANKFGFKGEVVSLMPSTGFMELEKLGALRSTEKTSDRRSIMLKGYQDWAGRSLFALKALKNCVDILNEYTINIYLAPKEVEIAAELFTIETGIETRIIPVGTSRDEILRHHGLSRISIGTSISDGVPNSMLEAMAMGSLPIQSETSLVCEWVEDGVTGFIVPPEDTIAIEQAIRRAIKDDNLVDAAAEKNLKVIQDRLDKSRIKEQVISIYKKIAKVHRKLKRKSR